MIEIYHMPGLHVYAIRVYNISKKDRYSYDY